MLKFSDYNPNEGKEFLDDLLLALGIKFETATKNSQLKNYAEEISTADFYLPKYKLYIEYFEAGNDTANEEQTKKKAIYQQQKIPCIFLYPENLGKIVYTLDKKIQATLEEHQLKKELQDYRNFKFKNAPELRNHIIYLCVALFALIYLTVFVTLNIKGYFVLTALCIVAFYAASQVLRLYLDIFKRNEFPLVNLLKS